LPASARGSPIRRGNEPVSPFLLGYRSRRDSSGKLYVSKRHQLEADLAGVLMTITARSALLLSPRIVVMYMHERKAMPPQTLPPAEPDISDGGCGSGAGDTLSGASANHVLGLSSLKTSFRRLDKNEDALPDSLARSGAFPCFIRRENRAGFQGYPRKSVPIGSGRSQNKTAPGWPERVVES